MPAPDKQWDFFLAHAGGDAAAAGELYDRLSPHAGVFLAARNLLPGDDWDRELAAAQSASLVTVVLVSGRTDDAYYQREEIAAALHMARRDGEAHRVVPVYLDDPETVGGLPYGLRLKHGIAATAPGSLEAAAERLLDLLDRLRGAPVERRRRIASARAIARVTEGTGRQRLAGLGELTGVFRPLIGALTGILALCVLLLLACLMIPGLEQRIDRTLAVSVLGTMCAGLLMSLLFLFSRSIGLAREIVLSGPPQGSARHD